MSTASKMKFWSGFGPRRVLLQPQTWLALLPALHAAMLLFGPWIASPIALYGGAIAQPSGALLAGYPTIDPNIGFTSYALGRLAVHLLEQLELPLWNHYEGFGAPLLGEVQSAALFPPTALLALPGGQTIEHALLQIISGLGAYNLLICLSFRKSTSAIMAVAFEFCSLFVWLKNAMVNPIGFLIWLLVFTLRLTRSASPREDAANSVGLGIAAGLAVLGGFPETVLIFTVFLIAWTLFYLFRARPCGGSFLRLARWLPVSLAVAVLLAAPLLIGLAAFWPYASFGPHLDPETPLGQLGSVAALKYLFPYLSGPIFGYQVADEVGSIGGYSGLALALLALLGACSPGRGAERTFWASTAAVCLSASHGLPLIQRAVMAIPGLSVTAFYRQADVVWITALMLLAAHALESVPKMSKWRTTLAVCAAVLAIGALVAVDRPVLAPWLKVSGLGGWLIGSLIAGGGILVCVSAGAACRRPGILAAVLLGETVATFLIPTLSQPRAVKIDWELISFLQRNTILGRAVNLGTNTIWANFGSALNIRQINYNDIPFTKSTAEYIHDKLDPYYPTSLYIYNPDLPPDIDAKRQGYMVQHLANYGAAGVGFVLARPGSVSLSTGVRPETGRPVALKASEAFSFRVAVPVGPAASQSTAGDLSIRLATFNGQADGDLDVRICDEAGACREQDHAARDLVDNGLLTIASGIAMTPGAPWHVSLSQHGGTKPVAVWLYDKGHPQTDVLSLDDVRTPPPDLPEPNLVPDVRLAMDTLPGTTRVYSDSVADVFKIDGARPFMEAGECRLTLKNFDQADVDCPRRSELVRLEVWMPGWMYRVDGGGWQPVSDADPFQKVTIEVGRHSVEFSYDPYGLRWVTAISMATFIVALSLWLWLVVRRGGSRPVWSPLAVR